MLVLKRRQGEKVIVMVIDGIQRKHKVVVSVNKILENAVSLGFDAPKEVRIVRDELEAIPA